MRLPLAIAIFGFILSLDAATAQDSKSDPKSKKESKAEVFTVEEMFTVDTPRDGYEWTEVKKLDVPGTKGRVCLCAKEGSTARIVLTIEERAAADNQTRTATIKAHYNSLVLGLQKGGFTELKGTRPKMDPPIPDRSEFAVQGKNPEGKPVFIHSVTMFGNNIYLFQIFAESKDDADRLEKIAATLKEMKPEKPTKKKDS